MDTTCASLPMGKLGLEKLTQWKEAKTTLVSTIVLLVSFRIFVIMIEELFRIIKERGQNYEYSLQISIMEIYNETLRDLLGDPSVQNTKK